MARDLTPTDSIGFDTSTPGQLKIFIKDVPGNLPSTSGVPDGYILQIINNEASWTGFVTGEDTQARTDITALDDRLDDVEISVTNQASAIGTMQGSITATNTRVDGLEDLLEAVRQVPDGGSNGQAILRDTSVPLGYKWGDVALSGGTPGADGSKIYVEPGVPSSSFGANADLYIDETSADLNYYYKISGSWVLQGTLRGLQGNPGTAGTTFRFGTTVPASGLGVNGDTYYHTGTYDLYQKSGGAWSVIGNLRGAPGTAGAKGNTFASWSFNGNGDSYFQTPVAMTLQTPQIRNGATIVFAYSTDGTTFSTATFPLNMAANSIVRARATNVSGWASAAAAGS